MNLHQDGRIVFAAGEKVAGVYIYQDPFKCFLHNLCTPSGHRVSCTTPHDHLHHKGLMYALRNEQVSWWEETPDGDVMPGKQRHMSFTELTPEGETVGFTQHIRWEPAAGGEPHFLETRTLSCRLVGRAFEWTWRAQITAQLDCVFPQSVWSFGHPDGRKTNYHGLGIRLVRDFGGTGVRHLVVDGERMAKVTDGMGRTPKVVSFFAQLDPDYPQWPGPRVAITFEQHHDPLGLFAMDGGFGYLSMGPNVVSECSLPKGQTFDHRFTIRVEDMD